MPKLDCPKIFCYRRVRKNSVHKLLPENLYSTALTIKSIRNIFSVNIMSTLQFLQFKCFRPKAWGSFVWPKTSQIDKRIDLSNRCYTDFDAATLIPGKLFLCLYWTAIWRDSRRRSLWNRWEMKTIEKIVSKQFNKLNEWSP